MQILTFIQTYIVGTFNAIMCPLIIIFSINMIVNVIESVDKLKALQTDLKKLLAYIIFIVLANQLDSLMINHLLGWKGSTQFSISIILFGREFGSILKAVNYLGVEVPYILTKRSGDMMDFNGSTSNKSDDIDDQIVQLRSKISKLKKLQKLQEELTAVETSEGVVE